MEAEDPSFQWDMVDRWALAWGSSPKGNNPPYIYFVGFVDDGWLSNEVYDKGYDYLMAQRPVL